MQKDLVYQLELVYLHKKIEMFSNNTVVTIVLCSASFFLLFAKKVGLCNQTGHTLLQ